MSDRRSVIAPLALGVCFPDTHGCVPGVGEHEQLLSGSHRGVKTFLLYPVDVNPSGHYETYVSGQE